MFNYTKPEDIFNEFLEMTKLSYRKYQDHYKLNLKKIENGFRQRWGQNFAENYLSKYKLKFNITLTKKHPYLQISENYPYKLISFRTKNLWNSNAKTGLDKKLNINDYNNKNIKDVNFIIISSKITKEKNLEEYDKVKVVSKWGEVSNLYVIIIDNPGKENIIAMPVHNRKINYLTPTLYDPISKEPDYNNVPVNIIKL